jgi:hypothetical protein
LIYCFYAKGHMKWRMFFSFSFKVLKLQRRFLAPIINFE